jgi:hypothetical protein
MLLLLTAAYAWTPRCSTVPLGDPYVEVALSADPNHAIIAEQIAVSGLLQSAWVLADPAAGCDVIPVALPDHSALIGDARLLDRSRAEAVDLLGWNGAEFALQASLPTPQPTWSAPASLVGFAGDLVTVTSYDRLTFERQTLLVPLRADDPRPARQLRRSLHFTPRTWDEASRRVFGQRHRRSDGTAFTVFGHLTDTGLRPELPPEAPARTLLSFDGTRALYRADHGRPPDLHIMTYDGHRWHDEATVPLSVIPSTWPDDLLDAWLDGNVLVAAMGDHDSPTGGVGLWRRGPDGWVLRDTWEGPVIQVKRQGEGVIAATKERGEPPGETDPRPGVPPSPCIVHLLTIPAVDLDGDGALSRDDCDDGDAALQTASTEDCNGVDDDCDGSVDEGCLTFDTTDSASPPDDPPDTDPPVDRAACGCADQPAGPIPAVLLTLALRRRRRAR